MARPSTLEVAPALCFMMMYVCGRPGDRSAALFLGLRREHLIPGKHRLESSLACLGSISIDQASTGRRNTSFIHYKKLTACCGGIWRQTASESLKAQKEKCNGRVWFRQFDLVLLWFWTFFYLFFCPDCKLSWHQRITSPSCELKISAGSDSSNYNKL